LGAFKVDEGEDQDEDGNDDVGFANTTGVGGQSNGFKYCQIIVVILVVAFVVAMNYNNC
jgi:hypothetical protein